MTQTPNSKHLALISATGGSGAAILQRALSRGHRVTALVRDRTLGDGREYRIHRGRNHDECARQALHRSGS